LPANPTCDQQVVLAGKCGSRALTGLIESKRATGRQWKTFMDWMSAACGDTWNSNEILKICQERNRLIANVSLTRHVHRIGWDRRPPSQ